MDKAQFYKIFDRYSPMLEKVGFKRKTKGSFASNQNIKLEIILDKWGWDSEWGWGFIFRLADLNCIEKHDGVTIVTVDEDITPLTLADAKMISRTELLQPYKTLNKPKMIDRFDAGWFVFSDIRNLESVLRLVMPLVSVSASKWASDRADKGHPSPKRKRVTEEEWARTKKELDDIFGQNKD